MMVKYEVIRSVGDTLTIQGKDRTALDNLNYACKDEYISLICDIFNHLAKSGFFVSSDLSILLRPALLPWHPPFLLIVS